MAGPTRAGGADVAHVEVLGEAQEALHDACERGDAEAVRAALETNGVDINKTDEDGYTPLYLACRDGHLEVVNALLSTDGIEINQAAKYGRTPLHVACYLGHVDVVNALLSADGIEINQADEDYGYTPLHVARQNGHADVVTALLRKKGVDINQARMDGATPLWSAVNPFIQRKLLFQKNLTYEGNLMFFSTMHSVYLTQKKEAMKDFDAVTEFCLCVTSAGRKEGHALCSLACEGFGDVLSIVKSFLVPPKESLLRREILKY